MDFLERFLAQLGMNTGGTDGAAGEQAAMALRSNGAPATGIYDQNYAAYLGRQANDELFGALSAQGLFDNAKREREGIAASAEAGRKNALALADRDLMKSLLPAWLNNIDKTEKYGVRPNAGNAVSIDPMQNVVGRATAQDADETGILKDKAGVVETLTKSGIAPEMEWVKNLFPGVTQTSDEFDENGQPVFPDVGTPTRNRYSPTDQAGIERQQMASDATVQAARIRGAGKSSAPQITVNTIPGGDGRTIQDFSVRGNDPATIAAAMDQANAAFGRGNGQMGPAPQGSQLAPPQAAQVIDRLRRMKILQPGASTLNTQVYDSGEAMIVVDVTSGQQIPILKGALQ